MPIDPSIALRAQGIELQNPIDQYGKMMAIQSAQNQNKLAQLKFQQEEKNLQSTEAVNRLYRDSYNPQTGEVDFNRLKGSMAQGGFGSQIPGIEKQYYEGAKMKSGALKEEVELLDSKLKNARGFLETLDPSAPDAANAYVSWVQSNFRDPVIARALEQRGVTIDQSMQRVQQALNTPGGLQRLIMESKIGTEKFMEANKAQLSTVDRGGSVDTRIFNPLTETVTTLDSQGKTPMPAEVEAQKSRIARSGATNVNNIGESAYSKELGQIAAKDDLAIAQSAAIIPKGIAKIDEALKLLYNSDINTGLGAEVFTTLDKARSKFAADKKAGKRVEGTEYLDSLLGSDVFPQISALGIGARGMDTPAEREFLRNVITGTTKLDKSTLIKMTEMRRKSLESAAKVYNDKVDSGELDRYFGQTGRTKSKIEVTSAPSKSAPAVYATNPQTGQRIMSSDGGKTWKPVGN